MRMVELNEKESIVNHLLLLHLIDVANKKGRVEDNFKVQKLTFLAQKRLSADNKIKGFGYNFFRWERGPFSGEVNEDLKELARANYISWSDEKIELTECGKELVKECKGVLESNTKILHYIDLVASDYAPLNREELKKRVYGMMIMVPRLRKLMKIEDIPKKQIILFKTSENKARKKFEITENWLATLEILFDQKSLESLDRAQRDAKLGRICAANDL